MLIIIVAQWKGLRFFCLHVAVQMFIYSILRLFSFWIQGCSCSMPVLLKNKFKDRPRERKRFAVSSNQCELCKHPMHLLSPFPHFLSIPQHSELTLQVRGYDRGILHISVNPYLEVLLFLGGFVLLLFCLTFSLFMYTKQSRCTLLQKHIEAT